MLPAGVELDAFEPGPGVLTFAAGIALFWADVAKFCKTILGTLEEVGNLGVVRTAAGGIEEVDFSTEVVTGGKSLANGTTLPCTLGVM